VNPAVSTASHAITPLMFPSGGRQLLAVHYAPAPRSRRGRGILMCNQIGPDYAEYYKTGRMLTNMLVASGFDCLRFDYTGCGDSQGGFEDGSVERWLADIASARRLLTDRSDCSWICPCGFGFGGLLAAAYAATSDTDGLVLWEPVVDGRSYCHALRKNHRAWLRGSFARATELDERFNAMGFAATVDIERGMRQLRLVDQTSCRASRVFAVMQDDSTDRVSIVEHFARSGTPLQTCMPGDSLPLRPMRTVIAWLEESSLQ
jgi:alpha-beta hydrolase superfamily lysophospholipase